MKFEITLIFWLHFWTILFTAAGIYGLKVVTRKPIKNVTTLSKNRRENSTKITTTLRPAIVKERKKIEVATTAKPTKRILSTKKIDNPRKLYLFCKTCSTDRKQWTELEEIFGTFLNDTPKELRPTIILSRNYTFAEVAYGITLFPAFVFDNQNDTWTFDASSMNFTNLDEWLTSTKRRRRLFTEITHKNFREIVQNSKKIWLILLKNDNEDHESCRNYGDNYLDFLKRKLDEKQQKVEVGLMETVELNYVFVRKRLNIDPFKEDCPIYVKILEYHFETFNGWNYVSSEQLLTEKLVEFVETPFDEKKSKQITIELTDSEYLYHEIQFRIDRTLMNKTFIAIGITGGLSVIALAVSIFWGLKSSSFAPDSPRLRKP